MGHKLSSDCLEVDNLKIQVMTDCAALPSVAEVRKELLRSHAILYIIPV